MPVGTLKWFDAERGCGSILLGGDNGEVFVRLTQAEAAALSALEGKRVSFRAQLCERLGRQVAVNLRAAKAA